jgi:hypothetical protein
LFYKENILEFNIRLALRKLYASENINPIKLNIIDQLDNLGSTGSIFKVFILSKIFQYYGEFLLANRLEEGVINNIFKINKFSLSELTNLLIISTYCNPEIVKTIYTKFPMIMKITPYDLIIRISDNIKNLNHSYSKVIVCGPFIDDFFEFSDDFDCVYFIRIKSHQFTNYKTKFDNISNKKIYYSTHQEYLKIFNSQKPFKDSELINSVNCNKTNIECLDKRINY